MKENAEFKTRVVKLEQLLLKESPQIRKLLSLTSPIETAELISKSLCNSKREVPGRGNNTPLTIFSCF